MSACSSSYSLGRNCLSIEKDVVYRMATVSVAKNHNALHRFLLPHEVLVYCGLWLEMLWRILYSRFLPENFAFLMILQRQFLLKVILCARGNKRTGGTNSPPAHSEDSHQPLTQSWNTISSWTSPNQLEIYQIKPHFDQIGTVNVFQRLRSLTVVVFGFWQNQAGGW